MSTYVAETINGLVDSACSYHLAVSRLFRQWEGTELLPSKRQESQRRADHLIKAMNHMKDYATSLSSVKLEQIGDEILHRAQMCIYAVLAQWQWTEGQLPYRMHTCATNNYSETLILLLQKIKFTSYILIRCNSEAEFKSQYYEFVSSGKFERYREAVS